jgi:hypothetical protein
MKNLSHHTALLCDLVNPLLIRGIQMEECPKWVGWSDWLRLPHGRFLVFPTPAVTINFQNQIFIPPYSMTLFRGILDNFSGRSSLRLWLCSRISTARGLPVSLIQFLPHSQRILQMHSFRHGFNDWAPKIVFNFETPRNVLLISYTFEIFWNTFHIWDTHGAQSIFLFIRMSSALAINDGVNETLGITVPGYEFY